MGKSITQTGFTVTLIPLLNTQYGILEAKNCICIRSRGSTASCCSSCGSATSCVRSCGSAISWAGVTSWPGTTSCLSATKCHWFPSILSRAIGLSGGSKPVPTGPTMGSSATQISVEVGGAV